MQERWELALLGMVKLNGEPFIGRELRDINHRLTMIPKSLQKLFRKPKEVSVHKSSVISSKTWLKCCERVDTWRATMTGSQSWAVPIWDWCQSYIVATLRRKYGPQLHGKNDIHIGTAFNLAMLTG